MEHKLLSRDDFRNGVIRRDGHACVFCKRTAEQTPEGKLDAHHILERRLFTEPSELGGYFLNNGATVCEEHHMGCEMTTISVEEVREACGIEKPVIPEYFYSDEIYDKWGNIVRPNGQRLKGPLFYDESVQKVLGKGGVLGLFTDYVKYPRTLHLPWSQSINDDDRVYSDMSGWNGKRVIVTKKMDGENTSVYRDYLHARSVDGRSHPSRDLLKAFASRWQHDIPEGWRVCGENLYARHSIAYDNLPHHFLGFSIWNDRNVCLSWDDTVEFFQLLGIIPVEVLYDGLYNEKAIRALWNDSMWENEEGYVMRDADAFSYTDFRKCMAKFVREKHVQTVKHWLHGQPIVPNHFAEKF